MSEIRKFKSTNLRLSTFESVEAELHGHLRLNESFLEDQHIIHLGLNSAHWAYAYQIFLLMNVHNHHNGNPWWSAIQCTQCCMCTSSDQPAVILRKRSWNQERVHQKSYDFQVYQSWSWLCEHHLSEFKNHIWTCCCDIGSERQPLVSCQRLRRYLLYFGSKRRWPPSSQSGTRCFSRSFWSKCVWPQRKIAIYPQKSWFRPYWISEDGACALPPRLLPNWTVNTNGTARSGPFWCCGAVTACSIPSASCHRISSFWACSLPHSAAPNLKYPVARCLSHWRWVPFCCCSTCHRSASSMSFVMPWKWTA